MNSANAMAERCNPVLRYDWFEELNVIRVPLFLSSGGNPGSSGKTAAREQWHTNLSFHS